MKTTIHNRRALSIMVATVIGALIMSAVDGLWQPPYILKSAVKILLFLGIPLVLWCRSHDFKSTIKALLLPRKKPLLLALSLGTGVYIVILLAYIGFQQFYDINELVRHTTSQNGVAAENFVAVSLYISFINSFLEELFFRGFAFLTLKKEISSRAACVFSAIWFAIYHLGMIATGKDLLICVLSLIGLFAAGVVLNLLDEKIGSVLPSWLVHMFANFAINTIGFYILNT